MNVDPPYLSLKPGEPRGCVAEAVQCRSLPPSAVYRGQPGCLVVNGFYFCMDGHVAWCMYCVPLGPPAPLCARCLCLRSCQVFSFSCQPLPGDVGCRTGDLSLAGSRHRADTAPRLSNKRILSHRWVTLFMGLGAGGCAILGEDCWVRLGVGWVGAGSWAKCPSGGRTSHRTREDWERQGC